MQWLSAKTQNACLASIELAKRFDEDRPVGLKTIASAQNISSQFLVQILLQLKRAGLVKSLRGSCGGYQLALRPSAISLLDIVQAMEGDTELPAASSSTPATRILLSTWSELLEANRERLASITLESITREIETESEAEDMYYI